MTTGTPEPLPGSMTVPPLYGWEDIAVVLVLLVIASVAVGVVLSTGKASSGRSEWQAWLAGRSAAGWVGGPDDPSGTPGVRAGTSEGAEPL